MEDKRWREGLSELAVTENGELLITPPSSDPLQFPVSGVTQELYRLPSSGLAPAQIDRALEETRVHVRDVAKHMLGYQVTEKFNIPIASQISHIHISNEENPFDQSQVDVFPDSKWLERNVLDYCASLWHAKWPHDPSDPDSYWGYLLPIGVSEANIHAACCARDYLTGMFSSSSPGPTSGDPKPMNSYLQGKFEINSPNSSRPVGFYSADSHYSVAKAFQVCGLAAFSELGNELYKEENPLGGPWPIAVPSEGGVAGPGCIDVPALTKLVDFFSAKGHPIVIVFNYGTTFKGAYDDVAATEEAVLPVLKRNGMYERQLVHPVSKELVTRKGFWFHVDAALAGLYMPFIELGQKQGIIAEKPGPVFDFRLESVSSITTNIAKHVGIPWPCGVYMTKTGFQLPTSTGIEPFTSSRNGHIAPLLWSQWSTNDFESQIRKIADILSVAAYAEKQLKALERELGQDLWVQRTRLSLTIYFKKTNGEIFRKYSLSSQTLYVNGELRDYCHIYVMHHVQRELIDKFVEALKAPGAFPPQNSNQK